MTETPSSRPSEPTAPARQEVVLVRHGETEWSRALLHTGRTDIPLDEHGRLQARALGQVLRGRRFVRVLTSPLRRATETCRLAGYGDQAEVCDDLREWDYGAYEGVSTAQIRAEVPGWTVWTHPVKDGETADQVAVRVDRVIALARAADGDVALFGHGHALRVLAVRWCGLDPRSGRVLALDPATVSVLGYEHGNPVVRRWNEECDGA